MIYSIINATAPKYQAFTTRSSGLTTIAAAIHFAISRGINGNTEDTNAARQSMPAEIIIQLMPNK